VPRACVITSASLITPVGDGVETLFEALLAGATAPASGADPDAEPFSSRRIDDFDPRLYLKRKGIKHLSRTSQLAIAAAAGLVEALDGQPAERIGVVLGTAWASLDSVVRFEREAHTEGPRFVDPILFTETVANVPAGQVSIAFGWSALNATVSSGVASGLQALSQASRFLDEERAEIIVAGGSDELNRHLLRTLHAEGYVADQAALPLTEASAGPVGGEGACLLTLESEGHAAERGAAPACRLLAGVTGPIDGTGPERAGAIASLCGQLFARGGRAPGDVDLLVLSAAGDRSRDAAEVAAMVQLFGSSIPPAILTKAWTGECWAATAPAGVAIAAEAMRRGVVPPRPDGWDPAEEFAAIQLPDRPLSRSISHAVVLELSGAGTGAAVLLEAPAR
jgi:3-oxoacyl-[acyl-carrier-protein] synthase II